MIRAFDQKAEKEGNSKNWKQKN